MRNLIKFILRQHFFILFLLIETISLLIAFNHNYFLRSKFFNFSRSVSGRFYENVNELGEYLDLKKVNEQLATENEKLKNELEVLKSIEYQTAVRYYEKDTVIKYRYITSKVINNSTNKQYNYITLNKGSKHNIKTDMVVLSFNGLVGKVEAVNKHFSVVKPILNRDFRLSAKIKPLNYAGSLEWTGKGTRFAKFNEIPQHVSISKGDTIVTSGFSEYFPENITIGTIENFTKEGNFYNINVKLSTNFNNLSYVTVVDYLMREEQEKLENSVKND